VFIPRSPLWCCMSLALFMCLSCSYLFLHCATLYPSDPMLAVERHGRTVVP
jgi:hypothetical protein